MVLILEVIRRLDVTGVAYFEYERPSIGAFESVSPENGLILPEPLVQLRRVVTYRLQYYLEVL